MADVILMVHLAFIAFVVGGLVSIMAGYHRRRAWVMRRTFRGWHLACVLFVVLQTWAGMWCPLTLLENRFRSAEGREVYHDSFIQHWVGRMIYYDAPAWVFTLIYSLFGALVVLYWLLAERRRAAR